MNALRNLSRARVGRKESSHLSAAPICRIRCRFLSFSSSASVTSSTTSPSATAVSAIAIEQESIAASSAAATSSSSWSDTTNHNRLLLEQSGLLDVSRHGTGDAVILLNVGGKEFSTLRSTVATNPVLAEYVARAEANQELFVKGGSTAVFVDRDPTYFPLILNHLRNKVEGLSYYSASSKAKKSVLAKTSTVTKTREYHVQLPKDISALRDIYVEATHYRIPELEQASCKQNFMVTLVNFFGGSGGGANPFDQASRLFQVTRRTLVAMGSVGTVAFTAQQDINLTKIGAVLFPAWISEPTEEKDTGVSSATNQEPAVA